MFVKRRWVLYVLASHQKFLDIGQGNVAGLVVLWHDNNRAFLALYDGVNTHLFLLIFSTIIIAGILQDLQQSFERFVWTSEAACLGTGWSFESVDEIDDLKFRGQCICFYFFGWISLLIESRGGMFPRFADILRRELQFDLLVNALRLRSLSQEILADLTSVRYGHVIHSVLGYLVKIVGHVAQMELQVKPQRPYLILFLANR